MGRETQESTWPLPKFYFNVNFFGEDASVAFQEITGLESEAQVTEYRHQPSPGIHPIKMPRRERSCGGGD